jgi:predicted membrane protein
MYIPFIYIPLYTYKYIPFIYIPFIYIPYKHWPFPKCHSFFWVVSLYIFFILVLIMIIFMYLSRYVAPVTYLALGHILRRQFEKSAGKLVFGEGFEPATVSKKRHRLRAAFSSRRSNNFRIE